jgi:enoyl-CoA hydratase/carnithine racemase
MSNWNFSEQITSSAVYQGENGYVTLEELEYNGKKGGALHYRHPDNKRLHIVDVTGMEEFEQAVQLLEERADSWDFCVLYGDYDPVHAGADITQFAGDCDIPAIRSHLMRGTELGVRIHKLWPGLKTVGVFNGDRYGGSVEWPMFAQYGICDSNTRIQFSEIFLGILPGWNGLLNVLVKSNFANARYMGLTGAPVKALDMQRINLVQEIANVPQAPDRRSIGREEWPAAWAKHAEECQPVLLKAALDVAVKEERPETGSDVTLADSEEISAEINRLTQTDPYLQLKDKYAKVLADTPEEDYRQVAKTIGKEVAQLGKPLPAPAVAKIDVLLDKWRNLSRSELAAGYADAARSEAELCVELMCTEHRRMGVNAILSKNPLDRIAVFI